jgi:hypothetical protein
LTEYRKFFCVFWLVGLSPGLVAIVIAATFTENPFCKFDINFYKKIKNRFLKVVLQSVVIVMLITNFVMKRLQIRAQHFFFILN